MIPLTRPELGLEEEAAVAAVLRTGMLVQGARVAELEQRLAAHAGRAHAVVVVNGTAALELALQALAVPPGARVLCPDLTWPSPAHAVLACGAVPVLMEVDSREWNTGPTQLLHALQPDGALPAKQPAAAIIIDQFGNPSRVHELLPLLAGVPLVVDAACSLGSTLRGKPCGSTGVIACTSFHPRKVITTGEGGACLTDDATLAERMRELRNHGQAAPARFARAAGNERMSELAAAVGCAQMDRLAFIVERRRALGARYAQGLAGLPLRMQAAAPDAQQNHQTLGVVLEPELKGLAGTASQQRDEVIKQLAARGVQAGLLTYSVHRLPHMGPYAEAAAREGRSLAVSASIAERGLALPLYPSLSHADQDRVIEAMHAVLGS